MFLININLPQAWSLPPLKTAVASEESSALRQPPLFPWPFLCLSFFLCMTFCDSPSHKHWRCHQPFPPSPPGLGDRFLLACLYPLSLQGPRWGSAQIPGIPFPNSAPTAKCAFASNLRYPWHFSGGLSCTTAPLYPHREPECLDYVNQGGP